MYDFISGRIDSIYSTYVVLENNGIGYKIYTPNPYVFKENDNVKIYVYEYVREDEIKNLSIYENGEIYLLNTHISPYKQGNIFNHEETRTRKLLLHKKEILKIFNKVNIEGYTLIPLKIYFKKSKAKLLLGVCRGKKNYNKIQVLKEKDLAREMAKNTKFR